MITPNKIATLTGTAISDNESFKEEGGFIPERDQYYFEMKQGDNTFLLGFKDMLTALKLLETMGEIPKIDNKWWQEMAVLYGKDVNMIDLQQNK